MKKAFLYTGYECPEDIWKHWHHSALREKFKEFDVELLTSNEIDEDEADFIFYDNMPCKMPKYPEKSYVWIAEPPVIYSRNFKYSSFKNFKKVFTWNNNYILKNSEKFIKLNYPQKFSPVDFDISKKEKLCALVAMNKVSTRKNELFSERIFAIEWFEKNALDDFDLFGGGWEKGLHKRFLNFTYYAGVPKCYRGIIENKIEALKKYKFSICYENYKNNNGYITEKIFDAFRASNVPIYLGEVEIEKYIPSGCYIKKADFKNYNELYKFLKNMDEKTYLGYLNNIQKYIESKEAQAFSLSTWLTAIMEEIL